MGKNKGRNKKAKSKKPADDTCRVAEPSESQLLASTDPFCELYCTGGSWRLIGESHGSNMTCPISLPGPCTSGTYSKVSPVPRSRTAALRDVPINTGDYVLSDIATLQLVQGNYDPEHYCPNELTIDEYAARGPGEWAIAIVLRMALAMPRIVGMTVNIDALPFPDDE